MGNLKWPSFVIQGIILTTNISFLLRGAAYRNIWLILSVFFVLAIFSLQTTSERWIFLFPERNGRPTPHIDTHILRIGIMIALIFLFVGIYEASGLPFDISWIILIFLVLFIIPLIFNFLINPKIKDKIDKKFGKE